MVESLEREMELLCLTGVEDQLQVDVRPTLELLRNAGIKVHKHNCFQLYTIILTVDKSRIVFLRFVIFCLTLGYFISDLDVNRRQT